MKKTAFATMLVAVLLFSAGTSLVRLGKANPYFAHVEVPSPITPTINIQSPKDGSVYASSNITLNLTVKLDNSSAWTKLLVIYYKASWQDTNVTIYEWKYYDLYNLDPTNDDPVISEYNCELKLTEIPDGTQNVTVTALGEGGYAQDVIYYYFYVDGFNTSTFVVDTTPPTVPVLAIFAAGLALAGAGFLFYKKSGRGKNQ